MVHYRWNTVTDNILCEQDDEGQLLATYTQEPRLYGELISQRRGGSTSYYHYDGQGSTRQLTDENGNVTDEYTYSAFGGTVAASGTTVNPFGYQGTLGYYANPENNDFYLRARSYEPRTARWLSVDPLSYFDGINFYRFVRSNPVNLFDFSGHAPTAPPPYNANGFFTCQSARDVIKWQRDNWRALGYDLAADLLDMYLNDTSATLHDMSKYCGKFTAHQQAMDKILKEVGEGCPSRTAVAFSFNFEFLNKLLLVLEFVWPFGNNGVWDLQDDIAYATGTGKVSGSGTVRAKPSGYCCCDIDFQGNVKLTDRFYFSGHPERRFDMVWAAGEYLLDNCTAPDGKKYREPSWTMCCRFSGHKKMCSGYRMDKDKI